MFRKAEWTDLESIEKIYEEIHTQEEAGLATIGWKRSVYPTGETAKKAILAGDMFVEVSEGNIVACAQINQKQVDTYQYADWEFPAAEYEVMVLHTLAVLPEESRKQYGKKFVAFYEAYAMECGCCFLRMDTNEKNLRARTLYKKLGFKEIGMVPCTFNGLSDVNLILLEKRVEDREKRKTKFYNLNTFSPQRKHK